MRFGACRNCLFPIELRTFLRVFEMEVGVSLDDGRWYHVNTGLRHCRWQHRPGRPKVAEPVL